MTLPLRARLFQAGDSVPADILPIPPDVPWLISTTPSVGYNSNEPGQVWDVAHVRMRPDLPPQGAFYVNGVQCWLYTLSASEVIVKYPKPPIGSARVTLSCDQPGATIDIPYSDPPTAAPAPTLTAIAPATGTLDNADPSLVLAVIGTGTNFGGVKPGEVIFSYDPQVDGQTIAVTVQDSTHIAFNIPRSNVPGAFGWDANMFVRLPKYGANAIVDGIPFVWA